MTTPRESKGISLPFLMRLAKEVGMEVIVITMEQSKTTPGTVVYEAKDSVIPTLYIKKGAFGGAFPQSITVEVKAN